MSDEPLPLTAELLDDFHAECEELLAATRDQLAALEHTEPSVAAQAASLEAAYRHLHSLKGNAAIVGLAHAERLAHAAEGYLAGFARGGRVADREALDACGRAVERLAQIIAAFHGHEPIPGIEDLVRTLGPSDTGAAPLSAPTPTMPPAPAHAAGTASIGTWRAIFHPTPDRDARGINVDHVRRQLTTLGPIVAARPSVEPGGTLRFEFSLALAQSPRDAGFAAIDGVTWQAEPEGAAASRPAEPADNATAASSPVVRVNLSRLDDLMRIVGEMVILRSRLQDRIAQLPGDVRALQEVNLGFVRSLRELRAAVVRTRLVPVTEMFSRLPFVVRDLTRDTGQQVRLELTGQDTEVDKYIVERLREPLLHLVRNALSHGIEAPAERHAAGKPAEATLAVHAAARGDTIELVVRDDGRGVNAESVAARARSAGLVVPDVLDHPAILRLLCAPGFSTREAADRTAGRGMGMNVVEATVRELGGSLSLETELGRFTAFRLRLPLTLAIADTFVVSAGAQVCAVPRSFVEEIVQISADEVHPVNGAESGPFRGAPLPLVRLHALFDEPPPPTRLFPVLVVTTERGAVGLVVDRVLAQREVVVRPILDPLVRVPGVAGATELGDGRPVLILDAPTLSRAVQVRRTAPSHHSSPVVPS